MVKREFEGAVDLAQIAKRKIDDDAEKEAAAQEAARKRLIRWDKAMKRTFKGIVPSPLRRAMLFRAADRVTDDED